MTTLYVFPDTNLFIQCHPLEQLNWAELGAYDEIRLIVCRTVQREIDRNKNRGNDRVGKRSRQAYSLFRRLALSTAGSEIVSSGGPRVSIELAGPRKPSPELANILDYAHGDDEIIGYTHGFQQDHPDRHAILLTHDAGAIMSARGIGVEAHPIDEAWRLEPENTRTERELARVQQELETLKKQEPCFEGRFVDVDGNVIEGLNLAWAIYKPLSAETVASAMETLSRRFPLVKEFGSYGVREQQEVARDEGYRQDFVSRIARYQDIQYPEWLRKCEAILDNLHRALQREKGRPSLAFRAWNEGSRPGKDVLLEVRASGSIKIRPPLPETGLLSEEDDEEVQLEFPAPPSPPKERADVAEVLKGIGSFVGGGLLAMSDPGRFLAGGPDKRRDPNVLYYKPNRPVQPTDHFALECEQWRHGTAEKSVRVEVAWDSDLTEARGTLECAIHAENLTSVMRRRLVVAVVVDEVDSAEYVEALIQKLGQAYQP